MAGQAESYTHIDDRVRIALLALGWETPHPEPGPATAQALCFHLGALRYLTAVYIDRLGPEVAALVDAGAEAASAHWTDPGGPGHD